MLGSIDPYLKTLIVDEVEQHDGRPFFLQFIERITSPTCVDPVTSKFIIPISVRSSSSQLLINYL